MDRAASRRWLSWLLVPAAAALAWSGLSLQRHAYHGVLVNNDRVETVEPGSPGARAGLRPGDHVYVRTPSGARRPGRDALVLALPDRPIVLERERGGQRSTVWLAPEPLAESERRSRVAQFAIAAGFLLLGGWVWSERRDRLTRVFFLLCLAFAAMLAPPPRLENAALVLVNDICVLAAQVFLPALFAHFFALFPEPEGRPGRATIWIKTGYAVAGMLFIAWLAFTAEREWGAGRWSEASAPLTVASGIWFALGVLGGLVLFAGSFVRAGSSDARRRLRVAFVGTLLGAAPLATLIALRNLSPGTVVPGERWALFATLLIPASFAYGIAVHRLFDFRVALRAVTVTLIAALVAVATYTLGEWMAASLWPQLGAGVTGAALAFLALIAALAGPARPWVAALGARMVPFRGDESLASWRTFDYAARASAPDALLAAACESLVRALRLDGCAAIALEGGPPRPAAAVGIPLRPALGAGFAEALGRIGMPSAIEDGDFAPADRDALELAGVHWVLPVPGEPVAAALLLGRRLAGAWLDRSEARELARFADHLSVALENIALKRAARSHGDFDRELAEAHVIQMHRLPRRAPVYPTLECAAAALSTEPVGGDYYDFVEAGPREFTLAVGDAAGHGVPAALVLAGVQSRFRDQARTARSPGELLGALNLELVHLDQPEKFMGLLCARIEVGSGTVRFANGGLTPPVVRRADGRFEVRTEGGVFLGVTAVASYPDAVVELDAGDVMVLYTDGLTEAQRGDRMFGLEGVQAVLGRHAHRRAGDILEELIQAVRAYADRPLDDLTVVVLKQLTRPAGAPRSAVRNPLKLATASTDLER